MTRAEKIQYLQAIREGKPVDDGKERMFTRYFKAPNPMKPEILSINPLVVDIGEDVTFNAPNDQLLTYQEVIALSNTRFKGYPMTYILDYPGWLWYPGIGMILFGKLEGAPSRSNIHFCQYQYPVGGSFELVHISDYAEIVQDNPHYSMYRK